MVPNLLASSCCPSASTLAQKCPARSITGQVAEVRLGQNSTSGGASDSAANAWQANPAGPSGAGRRDDRDAGAEVAEDLPELGRVLVSLGGQSCGPTG